MSRRGRKTNKIKSIPQKIEAHAQRYGSLSLCIAGTGLLLLGVNGEAIAQNSPYDGLAKSFFHLDYGVCAIFKFVEGSYGALLTTSAGIVAILAAAFGKYSQAYNMMIVAVGCFIMRALISLFFGDYTCAQSAFPGLWGAQEEEPSDGPTLPDGFEGPDDGPTLPDGDNGDDSGVTLPDEFGDGATLPDDNTVDGGPTLPDEL